MSRSMKITGHNDTIREDEERQYPQRNECKNNGCNEKREWPASSWILCVKEMGNKKERGK